MVQKERLYDMMLQKSKQLRLRGNLVLGTDPTFDYHVSSLEQLVTDRR